ncbi:MAG: hypothetical protein ACLSA6_12430 [Holdemania massiliensis]
MTIGNGLELELIKQQIAQLCAFSLGRQKIEELQPSFSPLLIAKENRRIAEALQAVIQFGPMPFYGIRDLSRSLHTVLRDGVCTPQELIQAADHARGVSGAQSYLKSRNCRVRKFMSWPIRCSRIWKWPSSWNAALPRMAKCWTVHHRN